jgi:valyl-tRNA synthetase
MHPIMPFVTEELWLSLPWISPATTPARARAGKSPLKTLIFQSYPKAEAEFIDQDSELTISALKGVIEALRNFRGENGISPKVEFAVQYRATSPAAEAFLRLHAVDLQALARVTKFERVETAAGGQASGMASGMEAVIPLTNPPIELRISLEGLVNVEEESKRLQKEIEKVSEDVAFVQRKLSQETFLAKAPRELVEKERKREQELLSKQRELEGALAQLSKLASK